MGLLDKILGRKTETTAQTGKVTGTVTVGKGTSTTSSGGVAGRVATQSTDLQVALKENQLKLLKSKTNQDMINAAYKAAEKLGISPWVILKEEWANFTTKRDAKYKGPHINDLKHLDAAQKKALMDVVFPPEN